MENQNKVGKVRKEKEDDRGIKKEKENVLRHLKGLHKSLQALLAKEHPEKRD